MFLTSWCDLFDANHTKASYFLQDLVALVDQQKTVVDEQAKKNGEQSVTIDKQSNLIQQLQAETAVSQICLKN